MSFVLRSLLVFATITCCVHQLAEGQTIRRALKHIFCHRCNRYECGCAQPVLVAPTPVAAACVPPATQTVGGPIAQTCTKTCTTVHPVVETRYRQEQFMTTRTECRTALRQEAYCETVPTTCIENVTRDEGCYQMVWVPKPVTRQVAKTVYQQRTAYRNVPYQYTVQVPELKCRVVPEQTVRYVQKTQTFTEPTQVLGCAAPVGCAAPMFGPAPETANYPAPITPNCAIPNYAAPTAPGVPVGPTPTFAPTPVGSLTPPQQADAPGTPWTQVPQRTDAQADAQPGSNYMPVSTAQVQQQMPTAAAVWQTRR